MAVCGEGDSMSIAADIVTTAIASGIGASLATFFIQKYFDHRLKYYFDSHLEKLKANLEFQGNVRNQIAIKRLEAYPLITELIYRLHNQLKEIVSDNEVSNEKSRSFLLLIDQYIEEIYSARLLLELDRMFDVLHEHKTTILRVKNLLLDWIYITSQGNFEDQNNKKELQLKLEKISTQIDRKQKDLIKRLIKLTKGE